MMKKCLLDFRVVENVRINSNYGLLKLCVVYGTMPQLDGGQFVEIEVPDILTKEEKEYLANVIKPFKDKVTSISKKQVANLINLGLGGAVCRLGYYINIQVKDDFFASGFHQNIELVRFEENTMYQGMEIDKQYTLEELGLN